MKVGHNQNKAVMYVEYKNSKKPKNSSKERLDGSEYLITGDKAFYLEATGSYPGQGLEGSRA